MIFVKIKKLFFFLKIILKKQDNRTLDQVEHRYNIKWKKDKYILNNSNYLEWVNGKKEPDYHLINKKLVFCHFNERYFFLDKVFEILDKNFSNFKSLTEFGSGNGQNLLMLKKKYLNKKFYGYELSESGVEISKFAAEKFDLDVNYSKLNFAKNYNDVNHVYPKSDISFTFTALEQVSHYNDLKNSINNILNHSNLGCIFIEPIVENYPNTLHGKLSKIYHYKHNYIKQFEKVLNEIKIVKKYNKEVINFSGNPFMYLSLYIIYK